MMAQVYDSFVLFYLLYKVLRYSNMSFFAAQHFKLLEYVRKLEKHLAFS